MNFFYNLIIYFYFNYYYNNNIFFSKKKVDTLTCLRVSISLVKISGSIKTLNFE